MQQDSWPQKVYSSQIILRKEMRLKVCTKWLSHQYKSAILISEEIYIKMSFYLEEAPFMKVSQIDLRKNLIKCAHNKIKSRSLPHRIDITLFGPVVLLFHLFQPSKVNGLPKMSTMKLVLKLFIENVYEWKFIQ